MDSENRDLAIEMRIVGRKSLGEISSTLKVAKTTVYGWIKEYPLLSDELTQRRQLNADSTRAKVKLAPKITPAIAAMPIPFDLSNRAVSNRLRDSVLGQAITWFLDRGYTASIPVSQCSYDLVVESQSGLKKIQIKTTNKKSYGNRWMVRITKQIYDPAMTPGANGKRKSVPYLDGEIDLFFIMCGDATKYLVPQKAVNGMTALTLDDKYVSYKLP